MEAILRSIRTQLRLSMNGVTAASMREKGIKYRMNFGVDIPRLKQIALTYTQDKVLAETMWKDDVREMKILATMLCLPDGFMKEDAKRWVHGISQQEIREQACKNLFQALPYANELVDEWIRSSDENINATGHWLYARLSISHSEAREHVDTKELLRSAEAGLKSESLLMRQAALNTLKFFGRISPENAEEVMKRIAGHAHSDNPMEKEIFHLLSFEFGL